jgi:hypothetical protein
MDNPWPLVKAFLETYAFFMNLATVFQPAAFGGSR